MIRSRLSKIRIPLAALLTVCLTLPLAAGEDWPTYHKDAGRSAYTAEAVSGPLKLAWSFALPQPPTHSWSRNGRVRYDEVCQPVVAGDSVYFGDHSEGLLRAVDLRSGREKWSFQTEGSIRCAPSIWKDSVIIGSDDGRIYSLRAPGRISPLTPQARFAATTHCWPAP
jgi:outer membrane protein assembly factor BamB